MRARHYSAALHIHSGINSANIISLLQHDTSARLVLSTAAAAAASSRKTDFAIIITHNEKRGPNEIKCQFTLCARNTQRGYCFHRKIIILSARQIGLHFRITGAWIIYKTRVLANKPYI